MTAPASLVTSPLLGRHLAGIGWSESYRWDPGAARLANKRVGLGWHEAAEVFLLECGGLTLRAGASGGVLLFTDPVAALVPLDRGFGPECESWAGESLVAIGTARDGEVILMRAAGGRYFGRRGDVLVAYGENFDCLLGSRIGEFRFESPSSLWN